MAPLDWSQCPAPDSILGKASGTWAPATVQRAIALSHVGDLERLTAGADCSLGRAGGCTRPSDSASRIDPGDAIGMR
jgi:hypothetical protein